MFNGKMKAVTFSYDDGVTQDKRLIALFDKYGVKATFNLNSALLGKNGELIREGVRVDHIKNRPEEVRAIYEGHEVAAHTLTHPSLSALDDEQVYHEVEDDRLALSELCGYEVVGMAYPNGTECVTKHNEDVIRERTGILYARNTTSSHSFALQPDLLHFCPTVYHHPEWDALFDLGEKFIDLTPTEPAIFYIWGHAYEFDIRDDWARFESFLRLISNRSDIFYGTNKEVLLAKH